MAVHVATSLDEVVSLLAEDPERQLLAGGTDFMVEVNYRHRRPRAVVVVDQVPELCRWQRYQDHVEIGAGVTYTEIEHSELAGLAPALAQAARTIGSPQIRNAGTIGGNLATASPAGDTIPVLAALEAVVTCVSATGRRELSLEQLITGVKRTSLRPGEIIESVRIPILTGPQEFAKIGTRNAMVISVASVALVVDPGKTVRIGLGSVAPTPRRAHEAEEHLAVCVDWSTGTLATSDAARAAVLAQAAASPIDDHRSTAAYRRHAVAVLTTRVLRRAFATEAGQGGPTP